MLDRHKHPFYKHSDAAFFLALDDGGRAIGRLAVLDNRNYNAYDKESTAFFYLFESEDNRAASHALIRSPGSGAAVLGNCGDAFSRRMKSA